jgi:putative FmdB family regulatory protein
MPTYLYECPVHGEFEEYHSMSIKLEHCPTCEKDSVTSEVKRLICGNTRGVVELTGHELVAKTKEDIVKLKKEMRENTNLYANMLGEEKYHNLQTRIDRQKR